MQLPVGNEATAVEVELMEGTESKARKFTIKIKFAAKIDMSCLEQVLKGECKNNTPSQIFSFKMALHFKNPFSNSCYRAKSTYIRQARCRLKRCSHHHYTGSGYGDVPQETLVIADIVIRHFPSMRYITAGRSMYQRPEGKDRLSLGEATELWTGM